MSKFPARNDVGEHEQIMRAALARNVARAIQLHKAHIERTPDQVAESLAVGRARSGCEPPTAKT